MSCKFAGEATDPEKLWKICEERRSAWSRVPSSRFNLDGVYHPNGEKIDSTNVIGGHFLDDDVASFDAAFFGFPTDLAASFDPQFRMQLEGIYEALENAGLSIEDVAGSNTSVFAGAFFKDYHDTQFKDNQTLPRNVMLGVGSAMASNRLSHFFDRRGPSLSIDTGCSTTLVAFHQACQNSFAFDSRVSGYGRGEGSGTIIIKRLDDAIRDGDNVRAVVLNSGSNQDGKTETITDPSQDAQEALIRTVYEKAGLDPAETGYFEAHGTGTPTGDPLEVGAISAVFSAAKSPENPMRIGSVKSNIGHTETASSLASLIKITLALEKGIVPPSATFEMANPVLRLQERNLVVPPAAEPWPEVNGVRRASVNNFGYGGTNAHVIMEGFLYLPISFCCCYLPIFLVSSSLFGAL
ncbi:thiolase-like protein [Diaporthe sp. PMI_573]|nr:thiolase-like protein [Diaporthaceae sp. PMI_573]